MKRIISVILTMLATVIVLTACNGAAPLKQVLENVAELTSLEQVSFEDTENEEVSSVVLFIESESSKATSSKSVSSKKTSSKVEKSSSMFANSSSMSSKVPLTYPNPIERDNLLEKHHLKIKVNAWNDYMPTFDISGESKESGPRPHFVVSFTSTTDISVPHISVSAIITSIENTIITDLNADYTNLEQFKTFRVKDMRQINMKVGETLIAVVTFAIYDEKQTMTFYPVVEAVH